MAEYIDKGKALYLDFKINVSLFESRRKTAERAVQSYADAISKIPAADVRPVVRGKWVQVMGKYDWMVKCSRCNGVPLETSDFCPNCGADMREKS